VGSILASLATPMTLLLAAPAGVMQPGPVDLPWPKPPPIGPRDGRTIGPPEARGVEGGFKGAPLGPLPELETPMGSRRVTDGQAAINGEHVRTRIRACT
jgi:hypothetical protein